jgi:hypothetical protein
MNDMFRRFPIWWIKASIMGVFFFAVSHVENTAVAQTSSSTALSSLSEKELFKKADASYQAGRLEEAREALILGLAKKKKEDKKYTPLLATINNQLSDRETAKGEEALRNKDFSACKKQIAAAKAYATTARVFNLESQLDQAMKEIMLKLDSAVKQSDAGDHETALTMLESLKQFSAYLPNLDSEIVRIRKLHRQKLISEGNALIEQHSWNDAANRFQRVQEIEKEDEEAKAGLDRVERGRKAYQLYDAAIKQREAKIYREAMRNLQEAEKTYPEDKTFNKMREKIKPEWVQRLLADVPSLLTNPDDFRNTRDAYALLAQARELDPGNPDVAKYLPQASELLGANSLQRSVELEGIVDYSRIATASALRVNAQQRMPAGTVKAEELKNLMAIFSRKRASQILVEVDNLCAASPTFVQALEARTKNTLDSSGLPDLKIRTVEEYQKSPNEDTQFQEQRPDGKSATTQLTIGAFKYLSERHSSDKPIEIKSQYVSGTERVPNPDYLRIEDEIKQIRQALDARKNRDKPTPEGYTDATLRQKEAQLSRIDPSIPKDKISNYTYQKIEHKQQTTVEVTVTLRDYFSREALATDKVSFHDEKESVEIVGVKPEDTNGLQNQPVRMPSTEQILREAERTVLDQLEQKIRTILPMYTNRFFNEAEKAYKVGQIDDAIEYYLCHWEFMRGKLDKAQMERIAEIVKRETGFDLYSQGSYLLSISIASAPQTQ